VYSERQDPNVPSSFRRCDNCGQPTPVNLPQCVNCGTISAQSMVADQQARAERRFLSTLFSRATPVTYSILIFNLIIYFLISFVSSGDIIKNLLGGSDQWTLIAFGAKVNELIEAGEWFRFVTPIFIHIGLLHIATNSYALWVIGPLVERLYGSARYLLIYLLSGIGGVIGSFIWQEMMNRPAGVSAGASGAIFGLFGLLAVFGYRYRSEMPPNFLTAIKSSVLPVILINLFIGFSLQFIDNAAHVGGLISGAILAFLIPYLAPGSKRVTRFGLTVISICIAVIVYSFARAYQVSGPILDKRGHETNEK
jgi:rhomboid protease GluP